ncbi:nucleoside-diphosphate kinase [Nocardia goodfellowii]|uniref:Nucleoside diphosphate kinase n=1 Tax=Nocardia goodfellowii TaxID=882446 RepID=A0ABS4QR15_9NOCA|nr:nucleoside-diphosphate kinase [Nocardia goodfellowii]MBP2194117.1 nucleoside diphosphate kinase [Nocardia goodfellowii]
MTAVDRGTHPPLRLLLHPLTPSAAKVDAYAEDTYVQETVEHLVRLGIEPGGFAREHSLLLLKPDAMVARAVEPTLDWLGENGFQVVDAHRLAVNRHLVRAIWYFAWNIASAERRRLADLLVGMSDALVLVVRGTDGELPVPVRLTAAKGPTDPSKRVPGELRYVLGRHNFLLNLVHSPDDPADVLREFSIFFDERTRARLLTRSVDGAAVAAELAREIYAETPARSFDRAEAMGQVRRGLADVGVPVAPGLSDADCARLLNEAWDAGYELDPWSVLVLGSYVLPMRTGSGPQTLPPVTAATWLEVGT